MQPLRKWKNRSERKDRKTNRYVTKPLKNQTINKSKPNRQTTTKGRSAIFLWIHFVFTRGSAICSILGLKNTHFVCFYPRQTCSVLLEMQRFLFHYWRIAVYFYFSPYLPPSTSPNTHRARYNHAPPLPVTAFIFLCGITATHLDANLFVFLMPHS